MLVQTLSVKGLQPRVGIGVLVIREGKTLLGKRKGAHGSGYYGPPGGNLEFKETVEEGAARELEEEAGLKVVSYQLGPWVQNVIDDHKHYISLFVIVTEFEGEPQLLEPHKCEKWDWYDLDNLPSPLFLPLETLIKEQGIEKIQKIGQLS